MRILKIIFYEVKWKISPFRNSHPIFEFFLVSKIIGLMYYFLTSNHIMVHNIIMTW